MTRSRRHSVAMRYELLVAVVFALACHPRPAARPTVESGLLPATTVEIGSLSGLSGLAVSEQDGIWAVPERDRVVLRLAPTAAGRFEIVGRLPLVGVPDGTDTESLAILGPTQLVLGTETQESGRARDSLMLVELGTQQAQVVDRIELDYGAWEMTVRRNEGIEGLCAVSGSLWAAIESVGVHDGRRFAVLARLDLATRTWQPHRLWLTTETGKVSSIACRRSASGGGVEILAIERHFGVARVLQAHVSLGSVATDLEPRVVLDLAPHFDPLPNFEGIDWWGPDHLLIITDNDAGGVVGPTVALRIPAPPGL